MIPAALSSLDILHLMYVLQGVIPMTSFRLSKELEDKLNYLAEQENLTKSEVIKEA